jgi:hypothetical protein
MADIIAIYIAGLICDRPPRIIHLPLYEPLSRLKGATPTNEDASLLFI